MEWETVEDAQLSPDDLFDRICREEHLKHCIRLVRSEVLENARRRVRFLADSHHVGTRVLTSVQGGAVHGIGSRPLEGILGRLRPVVNCFTNRLTGIVPIRRRDNLAARIPTDTRTRR